ncbi:MAG: sulfurtransferase TusA family protein [Actinomycetia bacterium]|nr:sulfurtransferase TusA family protein [Actinomycetes bacterium]MCH9801000.1 sulfurtransferase TusA family protein [Actinomycetes bacterium]
MTAPTAEPPDAAVTVDSRGKLCPVPVIELARAARSLGNGVIAVLADDPAAETDIPAWCRMRQVELICMEQQHDTTRYLVRV